MPNEDLYFMVVSYEVVLLWYRYGPAVCAFGLTAGRHIETYSLVPALLQVIPPGLQPAPSSASQCGALARGEPYIVQSPADTDRNQALI